MSVEVQEHDNSIIQTPRIPGGWIKAYRKIMDSAFYRKSAYVHLWLHLLLKAGHKETKVMWSGRSITLRPGEFVTGRNSLAKETGIPGSTIERALKFFENEQQIGQRIGSRFRVITIKNWDEYQGAGQDTGQVVDRSWTQTRSYNIRTEEETDKGNLLQDFHHPLSFSEYLGMCQPVNEDAQASIEHFLKRYRDVRGEDHPSLTESQWEECLRAMSCVLGNEHFPDQEDITRDENAKMVSRYFRKSYQPGCDHHLAHFLSEGVRRNLFFEACYRGPEPTRCDADSTDAPCKRQ